MDTQFLFDISVVIVSYNTRERLRDCLQSVLLQADGGKMEILVVDNGSTDGSAAMVSTDFPAVRLIESPLNLGFAAANNVAFRLARGRYLLLLNSDAALHPGALQVAYDKMESDPKIGLLGGKLVSPQGDWQPSARLFPSLLNDFLCLSGASTHYADSAFCGRADRTWASPDLPTETDWVPGAFALISHEALKTVGYFDERFFLYFEEVDLCKRLKQAGYTVWYWPAAVITHVGGESAKTLKQHHFSRTSLQLALWHLRSAFLYYRKHHGALGAFSKKWLEQGWFSLRQGRNLLSSDPARKHKAHACQQYRQLIKQAWQDTQGGRLSPPRPW